MNAFGGISYPKGDTGENFCKKVDYYWDREW